MNITSLKEFGLKKAVFKKSVLHEMELTRTKVAMESRMINSKESFYLSRKQTGAVLVVSLVILLVMTLLGVSNMEATSLQLKMASNNSSRQDAFHAAEIALAKVEEELLANGHRLEDVQGCADQDSHCYSSDCAGGRCFNGTFSAGDIETDCQLVKTSATPYWVRSDIWDPSQNKSQTVSMPTLGKQKEYPDPRYIVEFLCYTDSSTVSGIDCETNATDCAALFRITALAASYNAKARVMLQSTFKLVYQ